MKNIFIIITGITALVLLTTVVLVMTSAPAEVSEIDVTVPAPESAAAGVTPRQGITIGQSQPIVPSVSSSRVLSYEGVVQDPMNQGEYVLYGQTTECEASATCDEATEQDFSIVYDANEDFFTIVLYQEPLRVRREAAEALLINEVGYSQEELCALNYQVSVPYWVSETFAGTNLRFSFCPGAVEL